MLDPARLYLLTPLIEDATAFQPLLVASLREPVACVLLRFATSIGREDRATLVRAVQAKGVAALVSGEAREAARLGADGVHLAGIDDDLYEALRALKPDGIVGVGRLGSRDDAMTVGDSGADYLLFGEPRPDGFLPALLTTLDTVRWWADIFNVPCVAYASRFDDVWPLVEAGAEFIALGDAVWSDARGPAAAIASLDGVLSRKAFA